MDPTIYPIPHRTSFNLKKANWDRYHKELEDTLSNIRLTTNCQKDLAYHKSESNITPVPAEILERMRIRNDLKSRDPTLQQMNDDITRTTNEHQRKTWKQFVETLDHRSDSFKLWRTIKAKDGKSPPKAENEAINFDDSQVSSQKQNANYCNRQFTTSKLGRHTSSRETRIVSR